MKLKLFVALVAVLAAFTGSVHAEMTVPPLQVTESQDIDPRLVDQISEAVAARCELTCCEVRDAYYEGRMEIEKVSDGYVVSVQTVDGGIATVVIDDLS